MESGEEFGAVSASFLAAKGRTKAMDLLPTESGDKKYLGFLNVGWGMIRWVNMVLQCKLDWDRRNPI